MTKILEKHAPSHKLSNQMLLREHPQVCIGAFEVDQVITHPIRLRRVTDMPTRGIGTFHHDAHSSTPQLWLMRHVFTCFLSVRS